MNNMKHRHAISRSSSCMRVLWTAIPESNCLLLCPSNGVKCRDVMHKAWAHVVRSISLRLQRFHTFSTTRDSQLMQTFLSPGV